MDRRSFLTSGISGMKKALKRRLPEVVTGDGGIPHLDLTILTATPLEAERLIEELLPVHFGDPLLRLRQSILPGTHPTGMVLLDNEAAVDLATGLSLLAVDCRHIAASLALGPPAEHPTLVRYTNRSPSWTDSAIIHLDGREVARLSLREPVEASIEGRLGPMTVVIDDGTCRVADAPCTHRICTAHPAIITPGQRITCVPGGITISIG